MSATSRRDISGYERAVSALAGYVAGSMVATWQIPSLEKMQNRMSHNQATLGTLPTSG
jgi:hypothetical protein